MTQVFLEIADRCPILSPGLLSVKCRELEMARLHINVAICEKYIIYYLSNEILHKNIIFSNDSNSN